MQKTMELLTLKMTTHESLLTPDHDSDSVCKRYKQGPSTPTETAQACNEHPSNAGTVSQDAKPPDPVPESTPQRPPTTTTHHQQ